MGVASLVVAGAKPITFDVLNRILPEKLGDTDGTRPSNVGGSPESMAPKDELHPAGMIVGITESKVEDLWALSTRRGACLG